MTTQIRLSTDKDLEVIHEWLVQQSKLELEDNFLCNWNLTKEVHKRKNLYVYVNKNNYPIAYLWRDFGILDVKYEFRHKGIGRKLVKFGLHQLLKECVVVEIECAPVSAASFWEKMGFQYYSRDETPPKVRMYKNLERKNELFVSGSNAVITVKVFPKSKEWDDTTREVEIIKCTGVSSEGDIYLEERLIIFGGLARQMVLEVYVDDKLLKKARAKNCGNIGIQCCKGDFYSDRISVGVKSV